MANDSLLEQKRGVDRISGRVTRIIQGFGFLVASAFAFLELQNAPIDKITQAFDAHSFTKMGLFIFFFGWLIGAQDDTDIQRKAFKLDPGEGGFGGHEYLGMLVFFFVFVALFLLHEHLFWFQLALAAFVLTNMWTYSVVIMRKSNGMIRQTQEKLQHDVDNFGYFQLYAATEYLTGRWQRRRFLSLFALALIQLVVAGYLKFVGIPGFAVSWSMSGVSGDRLLAYVPSVLFIGYVLVSESWMKIYRFKILSDFETLEQMREYFRLSRLKGVDLPAINYDNLFTSHLNSNQNYQ